MKNVPLRFSVVAIIAAAGFAVAGYYTTGYIHELLISVFGTFAGLAAGLIAVNIYIDKSSRKIAAMPLALLIETAVNRLHNDYFIGIAHNKFGSTRFSSLIDDYQNANRSPNAFSPEDKNALSIMILDHKDQIRAAVQDLDQRFSTLISVLGWSFDAKVVAAALEAKRNASELIAALDSEDPDQSDRLIEHWFDVDLTANATRRFLAEILELDLNKL